MSFIEMKNICKKYAGAEKNSVTDFNLSIEEGEFIAFVGPSGCGKSTTLRMIAGFEEITSGDFYIDGKRMNTVLPRDRGISMVFQNYALYPHMTVEKNLDAKLRVSKRSEISKLHRQLGSTTIYVTHDQVEAMTMADRIVIMKDGVIQQVGKPMDLYEHPANKFVAGFIGSPQMNFYAVKVTGTTMTFSDGNKMHLPESVVSKLNGRQGAFILGIRGEDIKLDPQNLDLYKNNIMSATVDSVEVMGNENNLYFNFGDTGSVARVSKYEISKPGDTIDFTFVPSRMHFFDTQTEESLF